MSSLYTQMMDALTKEENRMPPIDPRNYTPSPIALTNQATSSTPPIEQVTRRLENEIAALDDALESLYQRLTPYLTQTNPSAPSAYPPQPIVGSSAAVTKLSELAERLSRMYCTLTAIKERLEI